MSTLCDTWNFVMKFPFWILYTEIFVPLLGYDDLSYGKISAQSSLHYCVPQSACVASNAVDRDNRTCMKTDFVGLSAPRKTVWWYVDLGDIYSVYSISILFKGFGREYENRQKGRFAGFSLYLSNTTNKRDGHLCYKDGPQLPSLDFTTGCTGHGSHVIFYNERLDGIGYPKGYETLIITELCEVVVRGCSKTGVYGENCDKTCSRNCRENRCNIIKGTCFACTPGWAGKFCQKPCSNGTYGLECKFLCTEHCKDKDVCNSVTGKCEMGCADGWTGLRCEKVCAKGTFGPNCNHTCSNHCYNNTFCNFVTGHCDAGCNPGYTGNLCNKECIPGRFGTGCSGRCSGHCIKTKSCSHVDGTCPGGCSSGYYGEKCDKHCHNQTYGPYCAYNCSDQCLKGSCNWENGQCEIGCNSGYTGSMCNKECPPGWFGVRCENRCSKYCAGNKYCDHIDGTCAKGCTSGYYGSLCHRSCKTGYFGRNCTRRCSSKCIGVCNFIYGTCVCSHGIMGSPNCTTDCPSGFYGINCGQICSGNCKSNETCNIMNGSCPRGCIESYEGEKCDASRQTNSDSGNSGSFVFALEVGIAISIFLNLILLFFILLHKRLLQKCKKQEFQSTKYVNSDETSPSSGFNDSQHYQELDITETISTYHNLELVSL